MSDTTDTNRLGPVTREWVASLERRIEELERLLPATVGTEGQPPVMRDSHSTRGRVKTPRPRQCRFCGKCGLRIYIRGIRGAVVTSDGAWYHKHCFGAVP